MKGGNSHETIKTATFLHIKGMHAGPKISIVMPNYNKGKFIGTAIESVLNQTFTDYELIVVDDASTDDSRACVELYAERTSRLRLIKLNKRAGSAASRNLGIRSARGEIMCFLDSDDVYSAVKLEKQFQALQEERTPVVVYCDWWRIDENGRSLPPGKRDHPRKSGRIFRDALVQVFGASTMFMVPKECFDKIGLYDESLPWAEDYDLVLRLARDFDFKYLDQALYGYRTHEGNKRNLLKRKERLYYEAFVTEKHFRSGEKLLDEETKRNVVSLLIRYYSLTGRYWKLLKYGFTNLRAFRNVLAALKNKRAE
jgi:glycosyltransferase involved in cell wall biosynthesis